MIETRGELHPNARLTADAVMAIRQSKLPDAELARLYGVAARTVSFARLGRTWAHLPGANRRREGFGSLPGEAHHLAKLDEQAVLDLRAGRVSAAALRRRYGVSKAALYKAKTGKTWRHLNQPEPEQS